MKFTVPDNHIVQFGNVSLIANVEWPHVRALVHTDDAPAVAFDIPRHEVESLLSKLKE